MVKFGPSGSTQALYYSNYANGGEIRRIVYTGTANRAPIAAVKATPLSGSAPLTVTLDASGSADPDSGDTLTYRWSFGDGTADTQTSTPTTQHVYSTSACYTAALTVVDNHGAASQPATARIDSGNDRRSRRSTRRHRPFRFKVGQTIQLRGSATDTEDGTLPGTSLSWTVIKHHSTHTHPFLSPTTGSSVDIVAPAPEDASAASTSYLEVDLTATDSPGLSRTTTLDAAALERHRHARDEPGRAATRAVRADRTVDAPGLGGLELALNAPDQNDTSGKGWVFTGWSDGGARCTQSPGAGHRHDVHGDVRAYRRSAAHRSCRRLRIRRERGEDRYRRLREGQQRRCDHRRGRRASSARRSRSTGARAG